MAEMAEWTFSKVILRFTELPFSLLWSRHTDAGLKTNRLFERLFRIIAGIGFSNAFESACLSPHQTVEFSYSILNVLESVSESRLYA